MGKRISMYTDGSYHPNTGCGGYAAISPEAGIIVAGNDSGTTNNKMELSAVTRGLAQLADGSSVIIHTDSQYVTNAFNKGWIRSWKRNNWKSHSGKPVKNQEEWNDLLEQVARHKRVMFRWVKGHNGNTLNEAVDDIANVAAKHLEKRK